MKKKTVNYLLMALLTVLSLPIIGFFFSYSFFDSYGNPLWHAPVLETADCAVRRYYSQLDGKVVKNKAQQAPQVIVVMIDNHPDAYPAAGLADARVVYEAPVEGQLTRFMAIFDNTQTVSQVGPVRSARPYYLDWLQEYGRGLYLHSGGSPRSLELIKQLKIFDANEFYWGEYYWRSTDREAPHNLYTAGEQWQKIVALSKKQSVFDAGSSWKYVRTVGKATAKPHQEVAINYSFNYIVTWKYDPAKFNYVRMVNGEKYLDAAGKEIRASNILIQSVAIKVLDEVGRLEVKTVGKGEARILKKGLLYQGKWEKKTSTARTRFYDAAGHENVMLSGTTWVEVIPVGTAVEVTS